MTDQVTVAAWVAASLSLNAVFLRRLLAKLDRLYDAVVGTTDKPGLIDRVAQVERHIGLADSAAQWPGAERRENDRREGAR